MRKWKVFTAVVALVFVAAGLAWAQYAVKNYKEPGGARTVIGGSLDVISGGDLDIESGGKLTVAGSDVTPELALLDGSTATTAERNVLAGVTAGTVAADKAVVVDSNKDAADFRNLGATNYDAGKSGTAGSVDVFPSTSSKGKIAITAADSSGDTTTTITNASQAGARTYTIPDAGASANFLMSEGAQTAVGAQTYSAAATFNNDVTMSDDSGGGDAGARNTLTAKFNIAVKSLGTMTNGSTETIALFDDTPAGECAEVGGQTVTNDAVVYRVGSNSLKLVFEATPPVAGEGVDCTISADNFGANESIGFWFRTDTALTVSGDLYVELDDDGGTDVQFDLPTVATINQWTWIELDISTCATCDIVNGVKIFVDATGAGTLSGAIVWFDFMHKWDADDEEALGVDLVQDGVLGVITAPAAAGSANTTSDLVENTGFFVNYQSTNDVLVTLTDQSANYGIAFLAHK